MAEINSEALYIKCSRCRCKYINDVEHIGDDFGYNRLHQRNKTCVKCRVRRQGDVALSMPYTILQQKCGDVNVVDKVLAYHGNENKWKSRFAESLAIIADLKSHCLNTIRDMGREGEKGKLWVSYDLLYNNDCSTSIVIMISNEVQYELKWLMRSLLRNLKKLK
jgi:hypothetical protein